MATEFVELVPDVLFEKFEARQILCAEPFETQTAKAVKGRQAEQRFAHAPTHGRQFVVVHIWFYPTRPSNSFHSPWLSFGSSTYWQARIA